MDCHVTVTGAAVAVTCLQSIVESENAVVNVVVVVSGVDELNKLAEMHRVGAPDFDGARDENANGIGALGWLDVWGSGGAAAEAFVVEKQRKRSEDSRCRQAFKKPLASS